MTIGAAGRGESGLLEIRRHRDPEGLGAGAGPAARADGGSALRGRYLFARSGGRAGVD